MDQNKRENFEDIILATGGYDHTIKFWLPHNGQCSRIIQHPNSQVNDLKISPNKTYLAAAGFQHIRIYNAANGNADITLEGFNKNVSTIGFQEDTKWLFSGGEDCATRVWDLRCKSHQSQKMNQRPSAVNSARLHNNQLSIFIGEQSGAITVWDLRKDQPQNILPPQQNTNSGIISGVGSRDQPVQSITICSELNLLVSIDNTGVCQLYSIESDFSFKKLLKWKAHDRYGLKCLFSDNGEYLVTTSADHTGKIWQTNKLITAANNVSASVNGRNSNCAPSLNPIDSNDFVCQKLEPMVILWDNNQRWVWDAAFSADSKYVFTASSDNLSRLWIVETGTLKREYVGHQKAVIAIAFSD